MSKLVTTPVHKQFKEIIKNLIFDGKLKPGEKISSERQLVKKYKISQVTVNKALSELVTEGLLYRKLGKGTFVSRIEPKDTETVKAIKTLAFTLPPSFIRNAATDPFLGELITGLSAEAQKHGFYLFITTTKNQSDEESFYKMLVHTKLAKGTILLDPRINDQRIRILQETNFPFVVMGKATGSRLVYYVGSDGTKGEFLATEHLIKLGHKSIGYIKGPTNLTGSEDRFQGYKLALEKYGLNYDPGLVKEGKFDEKSGYEAMLALIKEGKNLTAVASSDDPMAIGAIQAIKENNLSVPHDISVVGFNDTRTAAYFSPPLTSVRMFIHKLGLSAMKMLIKLINHEKIDVPNIPIEPQLIVRKSSSKR